MPTERIRAGGGMASAEAKLHRPEATSGPKKAPPGSCALRKTHAPIAPTPSSISSLLIACPEERARKARQEQT
jgi:hypothetical protein